jgi:predicted transcriptional regulator of viral defense system
MRVMARNIHQRRSAAAWELVRRQHGVLSRRQLVAIGYGKEAIAHRLAAGRLHRIAEGVYAAGRPQVTRRGVWMAGVLACEPEAYLSHASAAGLLGIVFDHAPAVHVSVKPSRPLRRPGLVIHRRLLVEEDITVCEGIPVTSPACTLVDLAATAPAGELERAINQADKLALISPDTLRSALDRMSRRPGIGILRRVLDRRTFVLTDSALERRFIPIGVRAVGAMPVTGALVNGFKVDFWWPGLGLVVETDGLTYHRTPAQQHRDRMRDQEHAAAGITPLRFTHAQVYYEPDHVERTLAAVARRLLERKGAAYGQAPG